MSALDLSHLSGPDAAVALRSYPRRFREAVGTGPDAAELAERIGPSGHSALELVTATAHTFVLLGQGLHQVTVSDAPVLHPAVGDPSQREWDLPPGASLDAALDQLAGEAAALADAIGQVHGDDWARTGTVAGGTAITALDIVKDAVRVGADNLRATESTMQAVRRG